MGKVKHSPFTELLSVITDEIEDIRNQCLQQAKNLKELKIKVELLKLPALGNATIRELFQLDLISVRTANVLLNNDIKTFEDLLRIGPKKISKFPNAGKVTVEQIKTLLKEFEIDWEKYY